MSARHDGVLVEELETGLVVYDLATSQAHSLDPVATRVWRACDGGRTASEIARATELDLATTQVAIVRLDQAGLLEPASGGVSRRVMLRRSARVGVAAAAATPLISTVLIPTAAAHASTMGQTTTTTPPVAGGGSGAAQLTVTGKAGAGPFSYSVSGGTQPPQSGSFNVGKVLEFDPYGDVIDPMTADTGYFGVRLNSDGSFDLSNQAAQPVYWSFTDTSDSLQSCGFTTVPPAGSVHQAAPSGDSFSLQAQFLPQNSNVPPGAVPVAGYSFVALVAPVPGGAVNVTVFSGPSTGGPYLTDVNDTSPTYRTSDNGSGFTVYPVDADGFYLTYISNVGQHAHWLYAPLSDGWASTPPGFPIGPGYSSAEGVWDYWLPVYVYAQD